MRGHLLLTNCLEDELTRPSIELALKENRLLWLDLDGQGEMRDAVRSGGPRGPGGSTHG